MLDSLLLDLLVLCYYYLVLVCLLVSVLWFGIVLRDAQCCFLLCWGALVLRGGLGCVLLVGRCGFGSLLLRFVAVGCVWFDVAFSCVGWYWLVRMPVVGFECGDGFVLERWVLLV